MESGVLAVLPPSEVFLNNQLTKVQQPFSEETNDDSDETMSGILTFVFSDVRTE